MDSPQKASIAANLASDALQSRSIRANEATMSAKNDLVEFRQGVFLDRLVADRSLPLPVSPATVKWNGEFGYFRRPLLICIIGSMKSAREPLPSPRASMLTMLTPRPLPLLSAATWSRSMKSFA